MLEPRNHTKKQQHTHREREREREREKHTHARIVNLIYMFFLKRGSMKGVSRIIKTDISSTDDLFVINILRSGRCRKSLIPNAIHPSNGYQYHVIHHL